MISIVTNRWKNILKKVNITINIITIHHSSMTQDQIIDLLIVCQIIQIQQDQLVQVVSKDPTEEIMMEKGNIKIIQCNDVLNTIILF